MRKLACMVMSFAVALSTFGEEPTKKDGELTEGVGILKQAAAAMQKARPVSYKADYKATGWVTAFVPNVEGTAVVGEQSQHKIDRFFCQVKIRPTGSSDVLEYAGGSDGDVFFLVDPKTKTCHQDLDPAVLGSQGRNLQRIVVREFSAPEPFAEVFQSGTVELKGSKTVGEEDCYELHVKPKEPPEVFWSISKKDFLPRRITRVIKNQQGEATTELTLSNIAANLKFVKNPFELVCAEGFKKTDEFAP